MDRTESARKAHGEVDLIGQRFGKLVVIEFAGYKNGRGQWLCDCDCGNAGFMASTSALRSGNTTSCRCRVDLTGQKFGDWTVLQFDHQDLGKDSYWLSECICGETKIAASSNIKRQGDYKCKHKASFIGKRFGRLVVTSLAYIKDASYWNCKCDCGNTCIVRRNGLTTGNTQSCGCLQKESVTTHGMKSNPLYPVWGDMIGRCENEKDKDYKHYGARGIKVCDRWHNINNFIADMGERPEGYEIERIDVEGDYCPENCVWLDHKGQMRNTTRNRMITYEGKTQCLSAWAEEFGFNADTARFRLNRGWDVDLAFFGK